MITSVIRRDVLSCNVTNTTLCKYVPIMSKAVTLLAPNKFVAPAVLHIEHFGLPSGFFATSNFISKMAFSYIINQIAFEKMADPFVVSVITCSYSFFMGPEDVQAKSLSELSENVLVDNNDVIALASLSQTASYLISLYAGLSLAPALLISGAALFVTDYANHLSEGNLSNFAELYRGCV